MKLCKKPIALLLVAVMLFSALLPLHTLFASSADADRVLFSSSFEASDKAITPSEADGTFYGGLEVTSLSADVKGEFTKDVVLSSITGTDDFKDGEGKAQLFDASPVTKFLTQRTPQTNAPVTVSFAFSEAKTVAIYAVTSANDEPTRDPNAWTFYGSTDGSTYVKLDSRTGQTFTTRGETKYYTVATPTAYRYYKLEITRNGGANMTQIADFRMGTNEGESNRVGTSPLSSEIMTGPGTSFIATGAFDGDKALAVFGKHATNGESYARNLLYSGLNIKVGENTRLSYVHFPEIPYGYDHEYSAMYMMIDLKFTDGKYLSELSALDQNGFLMTPQAKGESEALFTGQWNYVETLLSSVAKGKTIDSVYVYYHRDSVVSKKQFIAHFDDLVIENRAEPTYEHLSDYVNTLRGTNSNASNFSRGLTTPFITMPNGFNFFTPVTNSGANTHYDYYDSKIYHFSVSHVPSTWTGDYGTWQFMANTSIDSSNVSSVSASQMNTSNRASSFSHDNEVAKAHYYSVTFDEGTNASGVRVEMTPTLHGVYVRFTFPKNAENVNIVFDNVRAGGTATVKSDGTFTARSDHTDRGSRPLQVYGEFDQTPVGVKNSGKNAIAVFAKGTTEVTMKFTTSFLSQTQAKHSFDLEFDEKDTFDSIFKKAQAAWDEVLGRVEVEGATYTEKVTLYSNLYRMYAYPNLYSENEGTNEAPKWVYASPYKSGRKMEGKLYVNNGFWDTYRTAWAAYALITPELDSDLIGGILQHYKDNGWIPRWVAPGGTNSMLGTSSDIIFADAYIKGIEFDYEAAFESMLKNAATVSTNVNNGGRQQNDTAPFIGYVAKTDALSSNALSWTLEDYISDFCIGVMAQKLGYADEAEYYFNRSRFYVTMFQPASRLFIGKDMNGAWVTSNYDGIGWWGEYAETNGLTMSFAPVYDGNGLEALYGGEKQLLKKLNDYFNDSLEASKKVASGGIHEMIEAREVRMGQYSHSNQPAHAIPYLFVYAGAPSRTQEITREVLSRLYVGSEIGQGYCGDEDNGEMSAWYFLSALGLYPQNMGSGEYVITSPLFKKMTVHMDNGKDLVVIANNNSAKNIYIQSLTVNGKAHNDAFIMHDAIKNGATLVFEMGDEPSDWGKGTEPTSLTSGKNKADPAEDMVQKNYKFAKGELPESLASGVYSTALSVDELKKMFDNDSDTYAELASGTEIYVSANRVTRLLLYTVTSSGTKARAPKGLKLEATADGKTWVTLDSREKLTYEWAKYVRGYAIDDELFGNYKAYKLTVLGTGTLQVAEIEFLALNGDGDAGEKSLKPTLPFAGKAEIPDGPIDTPVTNTPVTGDTPTTGDNTALPSDSNLGLWIGIAVAAVVLIGSAVVFLVVFKKTKKSQ